jgi:hypothetical protein
MLSCAVPDPTDEAEAVPVSLLTKGATSVQKWTAIVALNARK